jgi:hypothetical protein
MSIANAWAKWPDSILGNSRHIFPVVDDVGSHFKPDSCSPKQNNTEGSIAAVFPFGTNTQHISVSTPD